MTTTWITPSEDRDDNNPYPLGVLNYGFETRMFAYADSVSTSAGVFVPSYKLVSMELMSDIDMYIQSVPNAQDTVLKPSIGTNNVPDNYPLHSNLITNTEEIPVLMYNKTLGIWEDSGLNFCSNGQLLNSLSIKTDVPFEVFFTVIPVAPTAYYGPEEGGYYINKRFRAYHRFVAPSDTSGISGGMLPNHLYQLKDTSVYPYVVKSTSVYQDGQLIEYPVFDSSAWLDLGVYNASLGSSIIGTKRTFRFLINWGNNGDLNFTTDRDLGVIRVGEYFGHTNNAIIKAVSHDTNDTITYELDKDNSLNDIEKYGIHIAGDGVVYGTAFARDSELVDSDGNDSKTLLFTVIARTQSGKSISKEFVLQLTRGLSDDYVSVHAVVSKSLERKWFETLIKTDIGSFVPYRNSDPRYGIRRYPTILIKENITGKYADLQSVKDLISANILSSDASFPVPTGPFDVIIGNYKYRTALDPEGNKLYDVVYRELLPSGNNTIASPTGTGYSTSKNLDVIGIRTNLVKALGEDTSYLRLDTDDMYNRAVQTYDVSNNTLHLDTVPRWMAHPDTAFGAKPGYQTVIEFAYLQPGQGEEFMKSLSFSGEYKDMVGEIYKISALSIQYHTKDSSGNHIEDSFVVQIPKDPRYL